jgi:putative FmdB family regulatory protein
MPTYDYLCDACEHEFELFQSIREPVKKKCPACGKQKLRRLFGTGAAVMFKQTDYRSDSYKKGAEADKKSSDSNSGSASDGKNSKSEAKPEAKPESKKSEKKPKSSD